MFQSTENCQFEFVHTAVTSLQSIGHSFVLSFTGILASTITAGVYSRSKPWIYVNAEDSLIESALNHMTGRLHFGIEGRKMGENWDMAVCH
jgi:azurin